MDLYDVMRTAFSAREFTDDPLPDETLVRILDHARFAPSGGNRQGNRVIVVRDAATREQLSKLAEPAAKRYIAQINAGESPWNTIVPTKVTASQEYVSRVGRLYPGHRRPSGTSTVKV